MAHADETTYCIILLHHRSDGAIFDYSHCVHLFFILFADTAAHDEKAVASSLSVCDEVNE
jgi:hypothetical protein